MLREVKEKLYYYAVQRNSLICQEYQTYVDSNLMEHYKTPWKHWWILLRLNWHYRFLRRGTPLYLDCSKMKNKSKQRLPYLDGAESELAKRPMPVHLAMKLLPYDVISFDIFDTLLFRPFASPTDLFHIVGNRLRMPEFKQLRIEAEKRAHEIALAKTGNREIDISDIYDVLEQTTGISKALGIQTELEVEAEYCMANPYMKQVYQMLLTQQKKIILVSDMYIHADDIQKILNKNGYTEYEKLYVSCDYRSSKHSKGLFKHVLHDYPNKSIVHIGDNIKSDIQCSEACGIKGILYQNINQVGGPYRADGMSDVIGSAYKGIVNLQLHSGVRKFTPQYEYGFICGGLYIFGFCNWIYQWCKEKRIDKIFFLSRDGAIYQRIFDKFFGEIENEYFLWSRVANTKYAFERSGFLELKKNMVKKIEAKGTYSLGAWLDSVGLSYLKSKLKQYGLTENTLLVMEVVSTIEKIFSENWEFIEENQTEQLKSIGAYIAKKVGTAKKVAVVDVGWVGSGAIGLKYLIEDRLKLDCKVYGLQAAAVSSNTTNISTYLLDGTISAYLFTQQLNRNNYDTYTRTNRGLNHMFFEIFSQAKMPSYAGINSDNGEYEFNIPEVENYATIDQVHQGIFDFCELYYNIFKEDPYMYHISGYDAYLPFRVMSRSTEYFNVNFGKIAFPKTVGLGSNNAKDMVETVADRLAEVKN